MDSTDKKLSQAIKEYVPADEKVVLALKGSNKEYLICTDKHVLIIKKGFMTGHTFGVGKFKIAYK